MYNFVMENDPSIEFIPKELKKILETRFVDNRIYIFNASQELKKSPLGMIRKFGYGDSIIGQTNFHEEDQIEDMCIMLIELMKMGVRLNIYVVLGEDIFKSLEQVFKDYILLPKPFKERVSILPERYKNYLNTQIRQMVKWHKIRRVVSSNPMEDVRLDTSCVDITAPSQAS